MQQEEKSFKKSCEVEETAFLPEREIRTIEIGKKERPTDVSLSEQRKLLLLLP